MTAHFAGSKRSLTGKVCSRRSATVVISKNPARKDVAQNAAPEWPAAIDLML